MTPTQEIIFRELQAGTPVAVIAKLAGCSKPYISNLKSGSYERKRVDATSKIKIAFLWGADFGVDQIAQKTGIDANRILYFLEGYGLIDAERYSDAKS